LKGAKGRPHLGKEKRSLQLQGKNNDGLKTKAGNSFFEGGVPFSGRKKKPRLTSGAPGYNLPKTLHNCEKVRTFPGTQCNPRRPIRVKNKVDVFPAEKQRKIQRPKEPNLLSDGPVVFFQGKTKNQESVKREKGPWKAYRAENDLEKFGQRKGKESTESHE